MIAGVMASANAPLVLAHRASTVAAATATSSSKTVAKPAGVKAGDVIVIAAMARLGTTTFSTPAGFTSERNDSSDMRLQLFKKIATASEPASYTVTRSSASNDRISLICSAFSGARYAFGLVGNSYNGGSTIFSVNGQAGGIMLGYFLTNQAVSPTLTPPADMTLVASAKGAYASIYLVILQPLLSPSGNKTVTWSATPDSIENRAMRVCWTY